MALVLANRVQETSTTTGTGTLTLAGAVPGFQTFAAGIGSGNTCYYTITNVAGSWEVGIGTVGTGTLARTTLLSSSTGSFISFTGTLNVFVTYPSEKSVNLDASNNLTVLNTTYLGGLSGNQSLQVNNVASAVNYLQAVGAVTGGTPTISALGTDTNISLKLTPKGTGVVTVTSDAVINGLTVGLGGGSLAQNAAFGGVTLPFNTTGNFNVAVGYQSMFYNKIGTSNVGLGFATLFLNTTANSNLAMGVSALTVLTTGVATLGAITAGSGYTNGTYTAVAMTPVSGATFVTYPTVTVVVSGGVVTSVTLVTAGQGASSLAATSLTVAATLIGGTGSGFSILVVSFVGGANNTAIGYQAGLALATGSNNTLIGYQAAASTTTVNNEITLGNSSVTAFRIPGLSITAAPSALTIGSQFAVTNTESAVNYLNLTGAATTAAPTISAQGSDANIGLVLSGKGTGVVALGGSTVANSGFVVAPVASSVNYVGAYGAPTGGGPSILAAGADANVSLVIQQKGTGRIFFFCNGGYQAQIIPVASSVNYVGLTGASTGNPPIFSAEGSDANINLKLTPKGTGVLQFGTYTAGVVAQAGYITITDAGGTSRRLLVG